MSRHKIYRQQMHLQFHGQPASGAAPEALAAFTRDMLMPAMEKVLEQHNRKGATLHIPSITLDGGILTGPHWQQQLTTTLCRQLDLFLRECLQTAVQNTSGQDAPRQTVATTWLPEDPTDHPAWMPEDESAVLLKILIHYLRTGSLPWYAQGARPALLQPAIVLAEQPDFYGSQAYRDIISQPLMLMRWLMLLPFSTAAQAMLGPQLSHPLRLLIEAHAANGFGEKMALEARRRLLLTLLLYQQHQMPAMAWQQQCQYYGLQAFFGSAPKAQQPQPPFTQIHDPDQALQQIVRWLLQSTQQQSPGRPTADEPTHPAATNTANTTTTAADTDTLLQAATPQGSTWPADHAGLILLHPFMPAFFQALHLTNEQHAWLDTTAHYTAVCRLFALANPEAPFADYDLLLAKHLCGWPQGIPIAPAPPPEPWELAEMNSLLQAVIDHWQRLGNTSPDGLRQAFLQRSGTLTKQTDHWELTMAPGSYDVLLSTLPWGIGLVKTPWMNQWLHVHWT